MFSTSALHWCMAVSSCLPSWYTGNRYSRQNRSYTWHYVSHTGGTVMAMPMFTTSGSSIFVLMSTTPDIVLSQKYIATAVGNRKLLYRAWRKMPAFYPWCLVVLFSAKSLYTALHMSHNLRYDALMPFNRPSSTTNEYSLVLSQIKPFPVLQLPYFRYSGASKNLDFDENGQAVLENIDRVTRIYPLAVPKHEM